MPSAYFTQKAPDRVLTSEVAGDQDKLIANLQLPAGSYVIIAKLEVAAGWGADTDLRHRISRFGLTFAGTTDLAYCDLMQGGLDTVVLTIAANLPLSPAAAGIGLLKSTARLYCIETSDDIEIKHVALTAIPVDEIAA